MDRTRTAATSWAPGVAGLTAGLALVASLLAGCAKPGAQAPGSGGTVHPSIPPGGFSLSPSDKPGTTGPQMIISGVMRAGVEANCMVLTTTEGTQYQLLGGDRSIYRVGARLTVTGHVATGIVTTCMQGTLFKVTKVVSAS
ncbi:MAG TPA: DUF5818 domain-containing protein [Micromonosporaceae bacterium]|nr:DUF5818 domain-containing protein [Micromonosporaceae bacterium]